MLISGQISLNRIKCERWQDQSSDSGVDMRSAARRYLLFNYLENRKTQKICTWHKMCVSLVSIPFDRNIYLSDKYLNVSNFDLRS
jgi:hypothetical protein